MQLNNFYNKSYMCLNTATRIREYLLPAYQYTKRKSEFEE